MGAGNDRGDLVRRLGLMASRCARCNGTGRVAHRVLDDHGWHDAICGECRPIREAAEALGECRRAMKSVVEWYRSLEMLEEWPQGKTRGAPSVVREVRAALTKLGGDHGDESKRVEEG